jgi:CBS domain-containing protein
MALRVEEVMNREVFTVRPSNSTARVRSAILALGITAAPVVDDDGQPVGMVSLRDLVAGDAGDTVGQRMSRCVAIVRASDPILHAARVIAATRYHHLPVVDAGGRVVGFVSAIDLLCGILGQPTPHPSAFPHVDERTGLVWTDDRPLDYDHVEAAPDGPGVLVLRTGRAGAPNRVVWVESPGNVRTRLLELVARPPVGEAPLFFRAARAEDTGMRELAVWLAREERA